MNGFINAHGFGRKGMLTVVIGAVINIVLDPLFIFVFGMGVQGAAIATVISQFVSALWAISFLSGKQALIQLKKEDMHLSFPLVREIVALGLSGFIMNVTNSGVQIVCNATLKLFGGDVYVGAMTIINSLREVAFAPINGLNGCSAARSGLQLRRKGICACAAGHQVYVCLCVSYTTFIWLCLLIFPRPFIGIFTSDTTLLTVTVPAMHIYFLFLYDGIANVRADCCCWPGALQTSDLLLSAAARRLLSFL